MPVLIAVGVVVAMGLPSAGPAAAPSRLSSGHPDQARSTLVRPVETPMAPAASTSTVSSFARLQRSLSGSAGVVVFEVGAKASAKPVLQAGSWRSGVAWSTAKVPVTVAALTKKNSQKNRKLAKAAITRSDNAAAESLWRSLGGATAAGKRTQKVVRAAGDRRTVVQHKRVRAGFTAFGQTKWSLKNQARFAAGLSCVPAAKSTVTLMGRISTGQRWGLGRLSGSAVRRTAFKGGWGPVKSGYLVRQLGIVTMKDGRKFGVAIAVWSPKGFTRGTQDLTKITKWLKPRLGRLDGGRCPKK